MRTPQLVRVGVRVPASSLRRHDPGSIDAWNRGIPLKTPALTIFASDRFIRLGPFKICRNLP